MSALGSISSREASDRLLRVLREGRWRPAAWGRFTSMAFDRSALTALTHRRALIESTVLHVGALALTGGGRGRIWVLSSWVMAVTHLGMLDERRSLGIPNLLTMVRGLLPALEARLGRSIPIISLATDFADGKIARATGTVTPFGRQADFLADTAFWTWFIARHEPSTIVKVAALAAWAAPVAAVTATSVVAGRMVDIPRAWWFRPAAAVEVLIGARAIWRMLTR